MKVIISIILVTLYWGNPTYAQDIIFGVEDYAPFMFEDESTGEIKGLSVDIVKATAAEVGDVAPEFRMYSWPTLYRMAKSEENVAVVSMVHSKERDKEFHWVGEMYAQQTFLWKRKFNDDVAIDTLSDLHKYRIVVTKSGIDEEVFTSQYGLGEGSILYSITHPTLRFLMVMNDRGDLFADNAIALKWNMRKAGYDFSKLEKVMAIPEMGSELSMAFSNETDEALVADYKNALKIIKRNGVYSNIVNKWFNTSGDTSNRRLSD